jgi:hypothetical protein
MGDLNLFAMISLYIDTQSVHSASRTPRSNAASTMMEVRFEGLEALSPGIAAILDQP